MPKKTLLEQIEEDALDSSRSVADALRKCIALGGRAGSRDLRDWASGELKGYTSDDELPEYRVVRAPIVIDGIAGAALIRGQQISSHDLPDVAQNAGIDELIRLSQGIGELEELAREGPDQVVRLGLPGSAELAKLMTHELGNQYQSIQRVYWNVSRTALVGVLDRVRTTLVELVAQIREETGTVEDPPAEALTNAVNVAIHGKAPRVTIHAAQATKGGEAHVTTHPTDESPPWWRTTKVLWALLVGIAGIAGTVIAYLQFIR